MEVSRQEYWSGLPFPSPGDLPDPGIEPRSPELWEDSLPPEPQGSRGAQPKKKERETEGETSLQKLSALGVL